MKRIALGLLGVSPWMSFAADFDLRVSTERMSPDAYEQKCAAIGYYGKRKGVPPYCDRSPEPLLKEWKLIQKEPGCSIAANGQFPPPHARFVQNLGQGWRRWGSGSFALVGKNCDNLHAFVRVSEVGFNSGWIYLNSPRPGVDYLMTFSRSSDESFFERGQPGPPPFNLPAAMSVESAELVVCRTGTPLNGCSPDAPAASLPAAAGGIVSDAQALLGYEVKPLSAREYHGKSCKYFTCPQEPTPSSPLAGIYAEGSAMCHDGEWYVCKGLWSYEGLCSDRGLSVVGVNISHTREPEVACPQAQRDQPSRARSEAEIQFESALGRNVDDLQREAEAARRHAEQTLQSGGPNPLLREGALLLGGHIAERAGQGELFSALTGGAPAALSGSGGCDGAKSSFQRDLTAVSQSRDQCVLMRGAVSTWNRHRASVASACVGTPHYAAMMRDSDEYANRAKQYVARECR